MIGENKDCGYSGICNITRMHEAAAENNLRAAGNVGLGDPFDFDPQAAEQAEKYIKRTEHFVRSYLRSVDLLPDIKQRCGKCVAGLVTIIDNGWESNFS